jgi:cutinase
MARRLNTQAAACPKQLYALGGYSQGAVVVHNAFPKIDKQYLDRIVAMTVFGDIMQKNNQNLPPNMVERMKYNCAKGDPVVLPRTPACEKENRVLTS